MQVKVNLKEYPTFWNQLKVAQYRPDVKNKCFTIPDMLEYMFDMKVTVNMNDKLGDVIMDDETFSWFQLRWA